MTVVCGDSHTSTHGAFAALAFGIGTSEVEHVLATQTLVTKKSKNMLVRVDGVLPRGCTAKDLVLAVIGRIGTAGGTGFAIEFAGSAIRALSMEGRMTVCNMAIEAGARSGMIACDATTLDYVKGRPYAPRGAMWDAAVAEWSTLHSDVDAHFDRVALVQSSPSQWIGCSNPGLDLHAAAVRSCARLIADKLMMDGVAPEMPVAVLERGTLPKSRAMRIGVMSLENSRFSTSVVTPMRNVSKRRQDW